MNFPGIKEGVRILGIDDGPFDRRKKGTVLVAAAVYRGELFDGLLTTRIRRDGWNATSSLARMIRGSKFWAQLHAVMLDGIALGGFNVVDIQALSDAIGLPVLAVCRKRPDLRAVRSAVARLPNSSKRWAFIEKAGPLYRAGNVWCQVAGTTPEWAQAIIEKSATRSHIPEPLRAAHLIAGGLILGQSGKRA